jgi:hypothetical protein
MGLSRSASGSAGSARPGSGRRPRWSAKARPSGRRFRVCSRTHTRSSRANGYYIWAIRCQPAQHDLPGRRKPVHQHRRRFHRSPEAPDSRGGGSRRLPGRHLDGDGADRQPFHWGRRGPGPHDGLDGPAERRGRRRRRASSQAQRYRALPAPPPVTHTTSPHRLGRPAGAITAIDPPPPYLDRRLTPTQLVVPASPRRVTPRPHKSRSERPARPGSRLPDDCGRDRGKIQPLPAANALCPSRARGPLPGPERRPRRDHGNAEHSQTHALRSRIS